MGIGIEGQLWKYNLIGCNAPQERVEELAHIFEVNVGVLPITYLGAPLGANPRRKQFFDPDDWKNED